MGYDTRDHDHTLIVMPGILALVVSIATAIVMCSK